MKKMMITMCLTLIVVTGFASPCNVCAKEPVETIEKKPLIQIAILLDTSGSMSGLIDQARTELWAIVNQFIFARKNGKVPELQVALFEYGKSSIPQKDGYIRMIVPLSTDLDKISEELFTLKTNGGSEYCGWVIKEATDLLQWSNSPDDLKVIFIAGNEPFTQGPLDYRQTCHGAISKGIIVNTIHCGSENDGINGKWKDGALLADGKYMNINHNNKIIHIQAPQDNEIAELNKKLNDTYVAYGKAGKEYYHRQAEQDKNAAAVSKEAMLQRTVAKSSLHYKNYQWDLVDAIQDDKVKIKDLKASDLPENMKNMSVKEKEAYIKNKAKQRTEIQQKIQKLNEKRKKYVEEEMKKQTKDNSTLGSAIIKAVDEQAKKRNFTIESQMQK